jgi:hemerythrin-like domain-containing protein
MPQVIAALKRDHANIEKVLELLESEILAIAVGKTPDFQLLQDIMCYMTQYPDRFHHPKEELLFAQILKHEPGALADVEALSEEHHFIGIASQEFEKMLRTSNIDSVNVREELRTTGSAYIRSLRRHMLKEEKKLFALATDVFTEEDWQAIDEAIDAIEDPLFGTVIAKGYERLYRLITDG